MLKNKMTQSAIARELRERNQKQITVYDDPVSPLKTVNGEIPYSVWLSKEKTRIEKRGSKTEIRKNGRGQVALFYL